MKKKTEDEFTGFQGYDVISSVLVGMTSGN